MEESLLMDLIETNSLLKYRDELRKNESDPLAVSKRAAYGKLVKSLTGEQLKLVKEYKFQADLYEEDINVQTNIKILNYGVKIGMQLQKAFDEEE